MLKLVFISLFSLVLLTSLIFLSEQISLQSHLISPLAEAKNSTVTPTIKIYPSEDRLKSIAMTNIQHSTGTFAIVIKNLKTNQSYMYNQHTKFEAASLYKLWVMASVIQQIQQQHLTEKMNLQDNVQELNTVFDIDPNQAELHEGIVSFTVNDALEQMITVSHNYAALLLTNKIHLDTISTFLMEKGFLESQLGQPPQTTAADIGLFFEKLYKGQLADEFMTQKMIELLKRQKLNNKIPKYLPQTVQVAHKTGEINSFSHDAGIVFSPKGDYIIVILSDSDNPADTEETIAEISRDVYSYFESM